MRPGVLAVVAVAFAGCSMGDDDSNSPVLRTTAPAPAAAGQAAGGCGRGCRPPPMRARWQYQLDGTPPVSRSISVYDVDGFDTPRRFVRRVHAAGGYAICYINAGTWEDWRPDRRRFPESLLGRPNGWPGERWIDVRRISALAPIMRARLRICQRKGFDAVEADNVDAYSNRSGFPIGARDQLRYNRWIARAAHRRGLAAGLKNDLDQAGQLVGAFDFAVVEQCFQYRECSRLNPFTRARKGVFDVEYSLQASQFCGAARRLRINGLRQRVRLDQPGVPCRR